MVCGMERTVRNPPARVKAWGRIQQILRDQGKRTWSAWVVLLGEVERVLKHCGVSRDGDEVLLVACSGGPDSMALAHAVMTLLGGRRVVLGHVDHAVRPGSAQDAELVRAFAERLGVRVLVERIAPKKDSEAELRRWRYDTLERMRESVGARFVLTAHTEDDQAETVLLALLRSARPESLRGMPRRRGRIVRPMLRLARREVRRYVAEHRVAFVEDPSNPEPRYLRNRIRKELLPLIERRYRSGFGRRVARLARRMAAEPVQIPHPSARVSKEAARPRSIGCDRRPWTGGALPDGRESAVFDADLLKLPSIRATRPGDRVAPFGMAGRRKVRDLLRESGVPVEIRNNFLVVADETDDVVWVPGVIRSKAAPVGPLTRSVWVFWIGGGSHQLQVEPRSVTLGPENRARPNFLAQEDE
jgi:tRNA(Ile)-lysidine synthetase-like protein